MSKGKGAGAKTPAPKAGPAAPQGGALRKPAMPAAPRMMQRKASARGR